MEAGSLTDRRIRLVLSRHEDSLLRYSLSEALPMLARGDSAFHAHVGISAKQAGSLDDEWSILRRQLFGLPDPTPFRESEGLWARYMEYVESLPTEPRKTGTACDDLPKMEAEPLADRSMAYTLARGELSIFAGLIDVMLVKVAGDRDMSSRGELSARSGQTIEEFEALRDELWRADQRLRGKPMPSPLFDPPRPRVSSGRVGNVETFAFQHRLARAWGREREPVADERAEAGLTTDGRVRIVVSTPQLQRLEGAFWP
jgi:hypothetical protein